MSDWISTKDKSPDEDEAVWLRCDGGELSKDIMFVGCCSYADEGWYWCNSYGNFWWDPKKQRWECDTEADDDYAPTHWMKLPNPPEAS